MSLQENPTKPGDAVEGTARHQQNCIYESICITLGWYKSIWHAGKLYALYFLIYREPCFKQRQINVIIAFDFLSYQLITCNQPSTSSPFSHRMLSSNLLWCSSGASKTRDKETGCLAKYLSFNHTCLKLSPWEIHAIPKKTKSKIVQGRLCFWSWTSKLEPWMLPKLSNPTSSSPQTGQAETPHPLRNWCLLDKEHQLMVWTALPAEKPAINMSLPCKPFGLAGVCWGLCRRGSHHPNTQSQLLLLGRILSAALRARGSRPQAQEYVTAW